MDSADTTRTYHDQFSAPEADLVCISQDGVAFRIPSFTLRMTSGFFRSTLSLPQCANGATDSKESSSSNDEPIFLSETSPVLIPLFRIISGIGIAPSELATLDNATTLLHAADKYEMPGVTAFMQGMIMHPQFMCEPLRVYGLSCRYGWTEVAKIASALTLPLDLANLSVFPILETLHSKHLLNLLELRWKRRQRLKERLDGFGGSREPYNCSSCHRDLDPHHWREWKWIILEEFTKNPSGKSILSPEFLNSPKADAALQQRCPGCQKVLFPKAYNMQLLHDLIDELPSTV